MRLFVGFALINLVFSLWPGIDLAVSGLFYSPGRGFALVDWRMLEVVRYAAWAMSFVGFFAALGGVTLALRLGARARVQARVWVFAAVAMLIGPGVLVSRVVKTLWGRARPADVTEFGGLRDFTPPLEIAGQCADNCSFVSGEASGSAMLVIVVALIGRHLVPRSRRWQFYLGLAAFWTVAGSLRIATGRHFLSDVVLAGVLMAFVALLLYTVMGIRSARHSLTPANLRADLAALASPPRNPL